MEAVGETLAIEAASYDIKVTLGEPGAVATDGPAIASSTVTDDDPYLASLPALRPLRSTPIAPEVVAAAIADVIEDPAPPLRVPVGESTRAVIAAYDRNPRERPFDVADLAGAA